MNQHDPEISAAAAVGDLNNIGPVPGRDHGGIQSVDIGMTVLRALAQAKGPMSLKEIGHLLDLSHERVRQIQMDALRKLRRTHEAADLRQLLEETV